MVDGSQILLFSALLMFIFHVVMLGLEVVISLIVVTLDYIGFRTQNQSYRKLASRYMNYIAVTYASQQVFLTATTVFLLSYFPDILILLGNVLFIPLGIFIWTYAFRLFLISLYWYGWDKFTHKTHLIFGTLFALFGVLVVYLDSVLLGFLNYTFGLISVSPLRVDDILFFINPTSFPLFFILVFISIAVTLSFIVALYRIKVSVFVDDEVLSLEKKTIPYFIKIGFYSLIAVLPAVLWYLLTLSNFSYYKFSNMVGYILVQPQGVSYAWLLVSFLLAYLAWVYVAWLLYKEGLVIPENKKTKDRGYNLSLINLVLALTSFLTLFTLNIVSQAPYVIADPNLAKQIPFINPDIGINKPAGAFDVLSVTIFAVVPFLIAFYILIDYFLTGVIGGEKPVEGSNLAGTID